MDAPVKILERMKQLNEEGRGLLEAGQLEQALAKTEEALELEQRNQRSLTLKADILEAMGKPKAAEDLRALVKQIKKEAWQKQVEAEARGRHEMMGEAIRREKL